MSRCFANLLGLVLLACFTTTSIGAERLVLLGGEESQGVVQGIDADGKVSGQNLPEGLELDGLRKIERVAAVKPNDKPTLVLDLIGGGRLLADSVTIAEEKFVVKWPHGEDASLAIDAVRAVRFKPGVTSDIFEAALAKPSADNDRLFVEIDGQPAMLVGLIESMSAESIVFQYEGKQQTVAVEKLFGIVVAHAGVETKKKSGVTVQLLDGSRLSGVVKTLADGKLSLTVGATATVSIPWDAVQAMSIRSARLSFLSDLDPVRVKEQAIVTLASPWQRDQNVYRKSLAIGERKFERGIGTHAISELAFAIDGEFDTFAVVIGIDAVTGGKGDCVFVVQGDERELLRQRMTGRDAAKEISLDIRGVKELVLLVEAGEDLDLADLADWADARVIRKN